MQLEDLPIELLERIAGYLDAHDVTLGLRPSSRLFARVLQRPRVALALSRAVAPSVFASVWGAAAGLGVLSQLASCRRKRFLFLVAASGVLENFKLAMDACGVTRPVFRNIMEAAAFSGSVPLLRWLLSQRGVPEVTDVDILTAAALGGHLPAVQQLAARGFVLRREGLCEGRLAAGGVLRPFPAAAASGNLALVQWLFAQRPCGDTASPGVSRTEAPGRSELLQACVLAAQAGHTNVVEWLCQPARWRRWDPARAATGDLALETGVPEPCWPVDAAQVLAGIAGGCPLHVLQHHFDSLAQPLLEQEQQAGELTQLGLSQTYPWREVMWAFWGRSRCAVRCLHTRCGEKESEAAAAGRRALAPLLRAEVLAAAAASGTQWREKVLFLESQGWGPQDDGGVASQRYRLISDDGSGGGKVVDRVAGLLLHRRLHSLPLLQFTLRGGLGPDLVRAAGCGEDSGGGAGAGEEGRGSDSGAAERVAWLLAKGYPLHRRALSMAAVAGDVAAFDVLLAAAHSRDQPPAPPQVPWGLDEAGVLADLWPGWMRAGPEARGVEVLNQLFGHDCLEQLCRWGHLRVLRRMTELTLQAAAEPNGSSSSSSSSSSHGSEGRDSEGESVEGRWRGGRAVGGNVWGGWSGLTWRVRRLSNSGVAMLHAAIRGRHWELAEWLVDNLCPGSEPGRAEGSDDAAAAGEGVDGGTPGEIHVCADLLAAVAARGAAVYTPVSLAEGVPEGGKDGGSEGGSEGGKERGKEGGQPEADGGDCGLQQEDGGVDSGEQGPTSSFQRTPLDAAPRPSVRQPRAAPRSLRDVVDMFGGIHVLKEHFQAALAALDDNTRAAALLPRLRRLAGPGCETRVWSCAIVAGNARGMRWLQEAGIVPELEEDLYGWALDYSDTTSLKQLAVLGVPGGDWRRLRCRAEQLGDRVAARFVKQELQPLLQPGARDGRAARRAGAGGGTSAGGKQEGGCGGRVDSLGWWERLACCLRPAADDV